MYEYCNAGSGPESRQRVLRPGIYLGAESYRSRLSQLQAVRMNLLTLLKRIGNDSDVASPYSIPYIVTDKEGSAYFMQDKPGAWKKVNCRVPWHGFYTRVPSKTATPKFCWS